MPVLFNNCDNREHARLFGPTAFFDLELSGSHATQARNLRSGAECVVASYSGSDRVAFRWYRFHRETKQVDPERGIEVRVFHGELERTEELPKAAAAKAGIYSAFFDKLGRFKQVSVASED